MYDSIEALGLTAEIGNILTDGLVLYDLNERQVVYINAAGTRMTGIQQRDTIKQITETHLKQVMAEDLAHLRSQYHGVLTTGACKTAEFGMLGHGEEKLQLQATGCVVRDRTLLVVFLRDITRLKEHEDYLVEFGAKKNSLLETLTHNLSGALNLTKNLTVQAEKFADKADDKVQKLLSLITKNNELSLKIINDCIIDEHERSPQIQIKATRVDLIEKIGFIYQQLQLSHPNRTVLLTSAQAEIHITTDEVKLLQIVNNLTANAIKFSHSDTPIEIHIAAKPEHVIISVIDRGMGIPDALKPVIFMRHLSARRPGLNGEISSGRGLSICKHLTGLLSGKIGFESTEGVGSTFFVMLPYELTTDGQMGM